MDSASPNVATAADTAGDADNPEHTIPTASTASPDISTDGVKPTSAASSESAPTHHTSRIEELEQLLAKRDAAIKTMKEQAKTYVANVDKKWQAKMQDMEVAVKKVSEEKATAEQRCAMVLQQQQEAIQRASAAEDALQFLKSRYDELSSSTVATANGYALQLADKEAAAVTLKELLAASQEAEKVLRNEIAAYKEQLNVSIEEKTAVDSKNASLAKSMAQLQQQVDTLQKQLQDTKKELTTRTSELETTKKSLTTVSTREKSAQQQVIDVLARVARLETEKADVTSAKTKLSDDFNTIQIEKEQLLVEQSRLQRQIQSYQAEVRELQVSLETAEAASAAARKALHLAESRADEAHARAAMAQTSAKQTDTSTSKMKSDLASAQRQIEELKLQLEAATREANSLKARLLDAESANADLKRSNAELEASLQDALDKQIRSEEQCRRASEISEQHQRKRLEAKQELVAVASSLERERTCATRMASTLGSKVIPKMETMVEAMHNLCATLDPSYDMPDSQTTDGVGDGDERERKFQDEDSSSPVTATLQEAMISLLDEADTALFSAMRFAAANARERQMSHRPPEMSHSSTDICSSVMKVFGYQNAPEPPPTTPSRQRRRRIPWSAHFTASSTRAVRRAMRDAADDDVDDSSKLLNTRSYRSPPH